MRRPALALRSATVAVLLTAAPALGQGSPGLHVERADGSVTDVPVVLDRGYAAVELSLFEQLGWTVSEADGALSVSVPGEIVISLRVGSPFFRWDATALQLADPPYREGGRAFVPVQLLADFLPRRLPDLYEFDGSRSLLRAGDPTLIDGSDDATAADSGGSDGASADDGSSSTAAAPSKEELSAPEPYEGVRVLVIDAGHGGADPGALGPDGIREKDVALGIANDLAELLESEPGIEVHLIRDDDTFVDLWKRGEIATNIKGDRPGLFISVHGNSFPDQRRTRGFETYFLSEARTEHERRVAAIENAPLSFKGQDVDPERQPDLDFILRELRNLDAQHWSALMAELVQEELNAFHPGPDRGVKQGMLAVLTNALMPSVLVEVGYLSNDDEGRLMAKDSFQHQTAEALARAVVRFFGRYPPGSGDVGAPGDP